MLLKEKIIKETIFKKASKMLSNDDIILISDLDEIPNLEQNNLKNIKNKLIFFKQKLFYYKFNLKLESFEWFGTKACKKNDLLSPQWLRNIKDKNYPFWRLDIFFQNKISRYSFYRKWWLAFFLS